MDLVSGLFLLVIVIAGGVIAVLADWLGRTIGKKRLRFLHLRPRHTATIFTALAGMLIPIITIFVVAAASSEVRQWILDGRAAIVRSQELTKELDTLSRDIKTSKAEVDTLEKEKKGAATERKELLNQNKELSSRATKLATDVSQARKGFNEAQSKLGRATRDLGERLRSLNLTKMTLKEREQALSILNGQVSEVARQLNDVTMKSVDLDRKVVSFEREIKAKQSEINQLSKSQTELNEAIANAQAENTKIQNLLSTARTDLVETNKKLQDGQEELRDLQEQIQVLKAISDNSRTQKLVYSIGDEVARIVVPENMANSAARNQVTRLLRSARISAESRGAKGSPAAGFFNRDMPSGMISADRQVSELVSRIAGYPEERLLVARALINSFAGEPVALEVDLHAQKKVFTAREVIAEARISGTASISEIIRQISNLMTGQVRDRALQLGMVPIAGQGDSLGNVDPDAVYEVVQILRSEARSARLQVLAATDIMSADPLKIEFRIR